jgi:hypothetical protein
MIQTTSRLNRRASPVWLYGVVVAVGVVLLGVFVVLKH